MLHGVYIAGPLPAPMQVMCMFCRQTHLPAVSTPDRGKAKSHLGHAHAPLLPVVAPLLARGSFQWLGRVGKGHQELAQAGVV